MSQELLEFRLLYNPLPAKSSFKSSFRVGGRFGFGRYPEPSPTAWQALPHRSQLYTMRRNPKAEELQLPCLPLRASAASMPRLTFAVERVTCPAIEVVALPSGDGAPSGAVATATKPAKATSPSRWQRLPPTKRQQLVGREASPMAERLRRTRSDVLQLPSIRPPRQSRPPAVQPLRSSMHLLDSSAREHSTPTQANVDSLRGCPGYIRSMSYLATARTGTVTRPRGAAEAEAAPPHAVSLYSTHKLPEERAPHKSKVTLTLTLTRIHPNPKPLTLWPEP